MAETELIKIRATNEALLQNLSWAFRSHAVKLWSHQKEFSIEYSRFVFSGDLELINQLGLDIKHIQATDEGNPLVIVKVRN